MQTPTDWLELFVARRPAGVEAWVDHTLGWWGLRDAPEVLVLFFADMVRRGASGGSAELYTPEQLARVDALALASLARRDSAFPYAARFMHGSSPPTGSERP